MKYKIGDLIKNNVEKTSFYTRSVDFKIIEKKIIKIPKNSIVMYVGQYLGYPNEGFVFFNNAIVSWNLENTANLKNND